MKAEHFVCEGCGECFEDNFTEYEEHIEECSLIDKKEAKLLGMQNE